MPVRKVVRGTEIHTVGPGVHKLATAMGTEGWMDRMLEMEWVKHIVVWTGCSLVKVTHKVVLMGCSLARVTHRVVLKDCSLARVTRREVWKCCKQLAVGIQVLLNRKLECLGWWVGVSHVGRAAQSAGKSAKRISGLGKQSLVKGWAIAWAEVSVRVLLQQGKTVVEKEPSF